MKRQWSLILAFVFALVVAIFAVINVEPVEVNYLFGTATWPLILVVLGSVVMGAIIIGAAGMFKYITLTREIRLIKKENHLLKEEQQNRNSLLVSAKAEKEVEDLDESDLNNKTEKIDN